MANNTVEIESVPVETSQTTAPESAPESVPESAPAPQATRIQEVEVAQEVEVVPQQEEPQPKRKPGRPVGAKSKVPGKPRAKRKVVVRTPTPEQSEGEQEELPRVLPGSHPIPTMSHDQKSALMLQLLREQAQTRRERKAAVWRSWFQ